MARKNSAKARERSRPKPAAAGHNGLLDIEVNSHSIPSNPSHQRA